MTAPNFCMLLRKHIGSARILSVTQPGLERILIFELEHLNELGDICRKKLIVEIMGKHSNLIFCQEDNTILDSIKHISANMSSVREVLPAAPGSFRTRRIRKIRSRSQKKNFSISSARNRWLPQRHPYLPYRLQPADGGGSLLPRAGIDGGFAVNALEENAKLHLFRTSLI